MDVLRPEERSASRHKLTYDVAHSACVEPLLSPLPKPDFITFSGQNEGTNINFDEGLEDDDARSTSQASLGSSDTKGWFGSTEYYASSESLPEFDLLFGLTQGLVAPVSTEALNLKKTAAAPSTTLTPCISLQPAFKRTRRELAKKDQLQTFLPSACIGPFTPLTIDRPSMFFNVCICSESFDAYPVDSSAMPGTKDRTPSYLQKHDDPLTAVQLGCSSGILTDILAQGGNGKSVLGLKLDVEAIARELNGQTSTD